MRAFGDGDAVGAASELISIARASLEVRSARGGESIRATTVSCVLTAATFVVRSTCYRRIIRTATKPCVLAAAAVEVRSASRQNIIGTALVRGRQAAALAIRPVCRCYIILAASVSTLVTWHATAIAVWSKSWECDHEWKKVYVIYNFQNISFVYLS